MTFIRSTWLWILLVTWTLAPLATFAYDGQHSTNLAYDGNRESAIGYDAVLEHVTGETRNETTGNCAFFAQFVEFAAAKTAPELLLDSNVVIGQGRQFLASGQNVVKASISERLARRLSFGGTNPNCSTMTSWLWRETLSSLRVTTMRNG